MAYKTPSKGLSPLLIRKIAGLLFDGFNDDDTAFLVGLPVGRIKAIRQGSQDIAVREAVLLRKQKVIAKLREGRSKNWQRLAWWLERRWPSEFAKPEVQLTIGASSITNNSIVITAEAAGQLASRAKPVNEAVRKLIEEHRPAANGTASTG